MKYDYPVPARWVYMLLGQDNRSLYPFLQRAGILRSSMTLVSASQVRKLVRPFFYYGKTLDALIPDPREWLPRRQVEQLLGVSSFLFYERHNKPLKRWSARFGCHQMVFFQRRPVELYVNLNKPVGIKARPIEQAD